MTAAVLSAESVLPAPLVERLRRGRDSLLRQRTAQERERADLERLREAFARASWSELGRVVGETLPDEVLPFVQAEPPADFAHDTRGVALTIRLPGLSPILVRYRHAAGTWRRSLFHEREPETAWAVQF